MGLRGCVACPEPTGHAGGGHCFSFSGLRAGLASTRSRRDLCCCGRRGSGRSARSRGLDVAFAASLHIIWLDVLFVGLGWRLKRLTPWRCSLTLRPVRFVYFRKNSNDDFNNVVLFGVFQFSDESQGPFIKFIFLFPLEDIFTIVNQNGFLVTWPQFKETGKTKGIQLPSNRWKLSQERIEILEIFFWR